MATNWNQNLGDDKWVSPFDAGYEDQPINRPAIEPTFDEVVENEDYSLQYDPPEQQMYQSDLYGDYDNQNFDYSSAVNHGNSSSQVYFNPNQVYDEFQLSDSAIKPMINMDDYINQMESSKEFSEFVDATQVNEMDLLGLIDRMEEMILNAHNIPLTKNIMIDRDQLLSLIYLLRDHLPNEISMAKHMVEDYNGIIEEAQIRAEEYRREAVRRLSNMINETEVTRYAKQLADQTVHVANEAARQIREGSIDYANKRLSALEEQLVSMLVTIQQNKQELR